MPRSRGRGSVKKLPDRFDRNGKKRPPKYQARYRDDSNREHARNFDLKRDAEAWLDEIKAARDQGTYVDPRAGRGTFREWFDQWERGKVDWQPGTHEAARRAGMGVPFADMPMHAITQTDVQAWVDSMKARGLKASTIRMRFDYVHMAFLAAVGKSIDRDPSRIRKRGSDGIVLPTAIRRVSAIDEDVDEGTADRPLLTVEQVAAIQAAARPDFRAFIAVCAHAGLRLGEAAGLQLQDIIAEGDEAPALIIRRQIQGATNATTVAAPPKHNSRRRVDVPQQLVNLLLQHVDEYGVLRVGGQSYLFTPDGQHVYNRQSAGYQWRRACEAAGVRGFTLHDARHFFASMQLRASYDPTRVQRALGHSSPSITLGIYSHVAADAAGITRAATADVMARVEGLRTERG